MRPSSSQALKMFAFVTLGNFLKTSYSPLAPFLKTHFMLNSFEVGLITSIAFIGSTLCSTVSGFFVDNLGPRNALKLAFGIIAVGTLLVALAGNYTVLVSGYFAMGFGYGIIIPSTNSAIMKGDNAPSHGTSMGIKQAGVPAGITFSTLALTVLVLNFSLFVSFIFIVIMAFIIFFLIPIDRKHTYKKGMGRDYLRDLLKVSKTKVIFFVSGTLVFFSWCQQSLFTFFTLFQGSLGFSIEFDEILLMVLLIGAITGRLFWGRMGDIRVFRKSKMLLLSLIMLLAGAMLIFLGRIGHSFIVMAVYSFVLGMNAIGWNSTYVTVISEIAPKSRVGIFSGFSLMIMGVGAILGTPSSGIILDYASYTTLWTIIGSLLVSLSLISTLIGRKYFSFLYNRGNKPQDFL